MQFKTLFTVEISHNYYRQLCQDFSFLLPRSTNQSLQGGRLIAKSYHDRLYVLFEVDDMEQPIVPLNGTRLRFALKLLNPFFTNFTTFGFDLGRFKPLYRNQGGGNGLDPPRSTLLVGSIWQHSLQLPDRPVTVNLKNGQGQILRTQVLGNTQTQGDIAYDLTGFSAGLYQVEELYPTSSQRTDYYLDDELINQDTFGFLEVTIDPAFYNNPPAFSIAFTARQETLKYYVVTQKYSDAELGQLSVTDSGFTEDQRPQITFTKVASTDFTANDLPSNLLGDPQSQVLLFQSQQLVPRQQAARHKIQLSRNGDILIPHLPAPDIDRSTADLIIQLSKP
ncbi:hypothetical protein ACN4EG_23435 [Alkalinema pantanalense CENA528]|uniref:hypothetical protein n=1 Tax=Alkalinema pantanalense TaxID=1620705 RepID=UPI003D6F5ECD